jgi:hypothetical protein
MIRLGSTFTGTSGEQVALCLVPTVAQPDSKAAEPAVKALRSNNIRSS